MSLFLSLVLAPLPASILVSILGYSTSGNNTVGLFVISYIGIFTVLLLIGIPVHFALQKYSKSSVSNYALTGAVLPLPFTLVHMAVNRLADNPWEVLILHPMGLITAVSAIFIVNAQTKHQNTKFGK